MNLPQLPREPIRPELENSEHEIWQPSWRCFCCQDSGIVHPLLVSLVIPNYDFNRDKSVVCRNPRCSAGADYSGDYNYDQRFTAVISSELDKVSRKDWENTVKNQFALIQQRTNDLVAQKSLRSRSRTSEEEALATVKHQIASSPEDFEEKEEDECIYS